MVSLLYVVNSNGERERFSLQKVYRSVRRVSASQELARKIAKTIGKEAYSGIRTSEISEKIKKLLCQETPRSALRFNLKEGMRKLGPSGFPFEKFIGEVFKKLDFETKINQYIPGFCLTDYEIDLLAQKENLIYIGECKYRNFSGETVHLRDALANYARFLDILNGPYFKAKKYRNYKIKTILITNAKFTAQAIRYSYCKDIELLGWKRPKNQGLEYLIEKNNLCPITILPSLKGPLKDVFVSEEIMLVQDVAKINPQKFSEKFKISPRYLYPLVGEAKLLIEGQGRKKQNSYP